MSTPAETKRSIENALANFSSQPLAKAGIAFFDTLGYRSSRRVALAARGFDELAELAGGGKKVALEPELKSSISDIQFLLQLTGDEIQAAGGQDALPFQTKGPWDGSVIESYLFFAIELKPGGYSRTDLSKITRAVNRLFAMPAMLLFRHGDTATLAVIHRRLHKLDAAKDVLEKVTLIKDVRFAKPHRAHIEILFDLSLPELIRGHKVTNFVQLHNAWRKTLDSSELNKRFFKEIADWYFWSLQNAKFPEPDFVKDSETYQAQNVIRLITRLIFCWFLKEKGLIPAELFDEADVQGLLAEKNPKRTTYYRAILQNLFFATLNTPMNSKEGPQNRRFCRKTREDHMIHSYYRHEDLIADKKRFLDAMSNIPFLNGGLFECLDRREKDGEVRIDGFSTDPKKCPAFPDFLFFAEQDHPDLNAAYGTTDAKFTVRGIIKILDRYKFTVAENTPIEEEVALDPELLGRVFENLLAAYNPETGVTARKQTGSFYTPREIVNYMVDEALIACLKTRLTVSGSGDSPAKQAKGKDNPVDPVEENLRHLFAYNDEPHRFTPREVDVLIAAIDDIKILDPACGSGAFPMGILHQLVHILAKLDPHNKRWKERQLANARAMTSSTARKAATDAVEAAFDRNDDDYGRKLYLIENCIYGVDIQPIAVQIAKLRFFISLIVNQSADDAKPNRDILSLPNLETKFVAANTLIGLPKPTKSKAQQMGFGETEIVKLEEELRDVRRQHFTARAWPEKKQLRDSDAELRKQIAARLKSEWGYEDLIADKVASWNPYDQNASAGFFDPEWMFGIFSAPPKTIPRTTLRGNLGIINEASGQTELAEIHYTQGRFDIVIGNPPYGPINKRQNKAEAIVVTDEELQYYKAAPQYEPAQGGMVNMFRLFIMRSVQLLNHRGVFSEIFPLAFVGDCSAGKLRKWLLENCRIQFIEAFPERDNPNKRVFEAAKMSVCILNLQQAKPLDFSFFLRIHRDRFVDDDNPKTTLDMSCVRLLDKANLTIPLLDPPDLKLLVNVYKKSIRVSDIGHCYTGEIDLTQGQAYISKDSRDAPLLRGAIIDRYTIRDQMRQGENLYLKSRKYLADVAGKKASHYRNERLAMQGITGVNERIRLKVTILPANVFCANSINYLALHDDRFGVTFLLGILNSRLLNYVFTKFSTNSNVNGYEVDNLPIPDVPAKKQEPVGKIVDKILAAKKKNAAADTSELEREIDELVYELYGLTAEEIKIVEASSLR